MHQDRVWVGRKLESEREHATEEEQWGIRFVYEKIAQVFLGEDAGEKPVSSGDWPLRQSERRHRFSSFLRANLFLSPGEYALYERCRVLDFADDNVQIQHCFTGKGEGFFVTGLYLSNKRLVFRKVEGGEDGAVQIFHLQWFVTSGKEITTGSFCCEAEWLLATCQDGSVYLVPFKSLTTRAAAAQGPNNTRGATKEANPISDKRVLGYQDDVTLIGSVSGKPSSIVVWSSKTSLKEYCIVGNNTGSIFFIDIIARERGHLVKLKSGIVDLQIAEIEDHQTLSTFLYITCATGCFSLLLERTFQNMVSEKPSSRRNSLAHENIILNGDKSRYQPVKTINSPVVDGQFLASIQMLQSGPALGIHQFDQSGTFSIYDLAGDPNRFPLYVLSIPKASRHVQLSERLIVCAKEPTENLERKGPQERSSLVILSKVACDSSWALVRSKGLVSEAGDTTETDPTVLQEITFSRGEKVLEIACLNSYNRKGEEQANELDISFTSSNFDTDENALETESSSSTRDENKLQSFVVTTNFGVYEIVPCLSAEDIFLGMILMGSAVVDRRAEFFGKSMGLDLFGLYENAADNVLADLGCVIQEARKMAGGLPQGLFFNPDVLDSLNSLIMRALHIYHLSNVGYEKMICKFVSIGRLDVVIDYLLVIVKDPENLEKTKLQHLSDVLLVCLLFEAIRKTPCRELYRKDIRVQSKYDIVEGLLHSNALALEAFLVENRYYNFEKALTLFIDFKLVIYALLAAHCRDRMPHALKAFYGKCIFEFPKNCRSFLVYYNYLEDMCSSCNGFFMDTFPTEEAFEALLANGLTTFSKSKSSYLRSIIPSLNNSGLLHRAASFFVPSGVLCTNLYERKYSDSDVVGQNSSCSDHIELFLLSCIYLLRAENNHFVMASSNFKTFLLSLSSEHSIGFAKKGKEEWEFEEMFSQCLAGTFGTFNSLAILHASTACKLWNICAEVLESQNCFSEAFQFRCRVFESQPRESPSRESVLKCSFWYYVKQTRGVAASCFDILCAVLFAGLDLAVSVQALEEMCTECLDDLVPCLNILLMGETGSCLSKHQANCCKVLKPLICQFSTQFFVKLMYANVKKLNCMQPTESRETKKLISELSYNLSRITTPQSVIRNMKLDGRSYSDDNGVLSIVCFTCLHSYRRDYFIDVLLKKLLEKLNCLPIPYTISAKLTFSEYRQKTCSLPCPVCLFNDYIIPQHQHVPSEQCKLEPWTTNSK